MLTRNPGGGHRDGDLTPDSSSVWWGRVRKSDFLGRFKVKPQHLTLGVFTVAH